MMSGSGKLSGTYRQTKTPATTPKTRTKAAQETKSKPAVEEDLTGLWDVYAALGARQAAERCTFSVLFATVKVTRTLLKQQAG